MDINTIKTEHQSLFRDSKKRVECPAAPKKVVINQEKMDTYTIQGLDGYSTSDPSRAIEKAKQNTQATGKKSIVFKNDEYFHGVSAYTAEGLQVVEISADAIIQRAKVLAKAINQRVLLRRNGNPYGLIDKKGTLVAA